jgi:NAD(P)-dependent dehydrogenase (short-subunit alcohol dehydrogenase family)
LPDADNLQESRRTSYSSITQAALYFSITLLYIFPSAMSEAEGTIVVTGANGGLGSALAKTIASSPELATCHGIYAVRDAQSAPNLSAALADGKASHPYDLLSLDLSKLETVRAAAETINARVEAGEMPPIRVLILNAGFQDFGKQVWTDNGLDMTFTANYLGHWLLTLLLLKSMDQESGRIVLVGSQAHESVASVCFASRGTS